MIFLHDERSQKCALVSIHAIHKSFTQLQRLNTILWHYTKTWFQSLFLHLSTEGTTGLSG